MTENKSPGIMRLQTAIEVSANAAYRWREQYKHWSSYDKFADGRTKGEIDDQLNSLPHTPENITKIINDGWAYPQCGCCGNRVKFVVELQNHWSSSDPVSLCAICLKSASFLALTQEDADE